MLSVFRLQVRFYSTKRSTCCSCKLSGVGQPLNAGSVFALSLSAWVYVIAVLVSHILLQKKKHYKVCIKSVGTWS